MTLPISAGLAAYKRHVQDEVCAILKAAEIRRYGNGNVETAIQRLVQDVGQVRAWFCDDALDTLVAGHGPDEPVIWQE